MAFYLALFNVNHVNDELQKHSSSHARRSKSVKPVLKDKDRRHSLSSTQEVADYRLLPRPRIIGSSHNLRRTPSPPPPHRRISAADTTLCNCDTDSPDNGRKKVTFDAEEASRLSVEKPRRKLSEGSFLGNREALSQSLCTGMETSQRAAEWVYSIHLTSAKNRRSPRGSTDNGNPTTPSTSAVDTQEPPPLPVQSPTPLKSPGPSIVLPIQCKSCRSGGESCGIDCGRSSNVEAEPLIQKRPQSRLPSILRRRSTSDRSSSMSVVFRRAIPYRSASPNHQSEAIRPTRTPSRLRSNQNKSESIPLIKYEKERNEMIRSNYY